MGKRVEAWRAATAGTLAVALWLAATGAAQAEDARLVRTADGCIEALMRVPVEWNDVKDYVDKGHRSEITTTQALDGKRMTELGFELKTCESERIGGLDGPSRDDVLEIFISLPAEFPDDPGTLRFYTVAIYTDWAELDAAFNEIGLPSEHVPDASVTYEGLAPVPGGLAQGHMTASVPAKDGFTAEADYVRGFVPAQPISGVYRHPGPLGLVRDHHVAGVPFLISAPLLSGSVTANDPNGFFATAMGAGSGENSGGFLLDERGGFTGTATIIDAEADDGHASAKKRQRAIRSGG